MRRVQWAALVMAGSGVFAMAGPAAQAAPPKVSVVAAEDFWGSIARQLGGDHAEVTSLIDDPDTEPHDYEAKPSDGVAVAKADVAVLNGIGYDGWMEKLLAANPSPSRQVVSVGDVVGVKEGGNPHQWYSPRSVNAVIDAVTEALKKADPADGGYFDGQRDSLRNAALKRYDDLRSRIREQFNGVPVGASESIVAPLAEDLGLKLITPPSFMDAVSEGNEPTARDKATVDKQITSRQIKVFIYNRQNSTPDVEALVATAKKTGVPVATVTETLVPKGATFQDWQASQLEGLADALGESTGQPATAVSAARATEPAHAPAADAGGSPARWLLLIGGGAFVAGGIGLAGAAAHRRAQPPMRSA